MESAPSGVSATLKADKANRESLAKQKSAAKVNLDNVLLELDEVQQMREQAEELEDQDLLVELSAADERLQSLKQEHTAELARLQEASQAAAAALRQRLRRLTGERVLSAKSPTAAAAATAGSGSGSFQPSASPAASQSSTVANVPASMPRSDSIQSSASTAGTAGAAGTAAPAILPKSLSATRLSDSWGSSGATAATAQQPDYASIPQYQSSYAGTGVEQDTSQYTGSSQQVPFSDMRLAQAEQPSTQQSMQSVPRTISDSKPPKPALSFQPSDFAEQQPSGRRQGVDTMSTQSGTLPNQMGRKTSLMSAGSGYQADSDSNSDTQVESSTLSRLAGSSADPPQDTFDAPQGSSTQSGDPTQHAKADQPPSAGLDDSSKKADALGNVSSEAEADKEPESPSLLGQATQLVGNAVWGAVHPIQAVGAVTNLLTGHGTETGTAAEETAAGGTQAHQSADTSQAESESANAQDIDVQQTAIAEGERGTTSSHQPLRADSGYESDVDLPEPSATDVESATAAPSKEDFADFSATGSGFASTPSAIKTSMPGDEAGVEHRTTADQQQHAEPAYASDAAASAPDSAHSKRSIAGLGMDQPGSASKRLRSADSGSPVAKLTQNFERLNTDPASPRSAAARKFFTDRSSTNDGSRDFTRGVPPSLGRTSTSSVISNDQPAGFSTHARQPSAGAVSGQGSGLLSNDQSTGFTSNSTHAPYSPATAAGADSAAGLGSSFQTSSNFEPGSSPTTASRAVPEQAQGFRHVITGQQYPISRQASQGSIETNTSSRVLPEGSEGFGRVAQDQQDPISTQASQGSIDTNAGARVLYAGAGGRFGGQSGFGGQFGGQSGFGSTTEAGTHARGLSQDLPGSAAGLVQADESGDFEAGPGTSTGTYTAEAAAVTTAAPLSSLPPSASWGQASFTPAPEVHEMPAVVEPAVHAEDTRFETQRSQPYSDVATDNAMATESPMEGQSAFQGSNLSQAQHDFSAPYASRTHHADADQERFDESSGDRSQTLPDVPSFSEGITDLPSEGQGTQGAVVDQGASHVPLRNEGGFHQGNVGSPSHGAASRPLHRQLSAQAESLLRQSSTLTDGGSPYSRGSPRRRPPPPPPGGYDPSSFARTASMASQSSTPLAPHTPSDSFQQPFASETLKDPPSHAEGTPQEAPVSAFGNVQHLPQIDTAVTSGTSGTRQLEKPESARKLAEAGAQPLPHSAFAAEHKQEPTMFAFPAASQLLSEAALAPPVVQEPQTSFTPAPTQREAVAQDERRSSNFAPHHEPDFTDLNPLSPKINQQPTLAKSQQAVPQSNPFAEASTQQQLNLVSATAPLDDDFAEPIVTAQQAEHSTATPAPPQASQGQAYATDQSMSGYPAEVVQLPMAAERQTEVPQQVQQGSLGSQAMDQAFTTQQQQQQPEYAQSRTTAQTSAAAQQPGLNMPQAREQASVNTQQLGAGSSQGVLAAVATKQQPGLAKFEAREQTLAPQQQQQQPTSAKSQGSTASKAVQPQQQPTSARSVASTAGVTTGQTAGKGTDLFTKPTAFDETVGAGPSSFAPAGKGEGTMAKTEGTRATSKSQAEPLSSWFSFEDPGQSSATPASTPAPQEDKQDFWGGSAFAEPVDSTAPQHQKLVEAGLTDKILAGSLFGDTSTGADSQMGVPMAKLGTAAQESAIPMVQQQQQQQQPPQSQPAAGVGAGAHPSAQQEPLQSAPSSFRDFVNSSNPFASPWAALTPEIDPSPAPTQPVPSAGMQQPDQLPQQLPQPSFDQWNSFGQTPSGPQAGHQAPAAAAVSQQGGSQLQGYPQQSPPQQQGPGGAGSGNQSWQSFSSPFESSAQQAQQPPQHQGTASSDAWGSFDTPEAAGQGAVAPRVAVVDSWASFDAPATLEAQDARVAYPSVHTQGSPSPFDDLATSRNPAAGSQGISNALQQAQHAQQGPGNSQAGRAPGRVASVTELSVENLGLDPSLQITAMPTAQTPRTQQTGNGMMAPPGGDYDSKTQSQAQQKPKRGSPMQFGSVFSPGSANSVSKLTNIFKSNKADKLGKDNGMPPNTGSMQPGLPPTPSYNGGGGVRPPSSSRVPPQGRGPSEVDLWRPQSAEERQQCMDAYDMKGYGRLGGLGEADARALWSRQNMPGDTFQHVWALSDLDSNKLLSKPEFCLFMYLMHALRNFGAGFRLPEYITPEQATRLLGLEGIVGLGVQGQTFPQGQAYSSTQGAPYSAPSYPPTPAYPPAPSPQQDWEASGGLSPSQQQAVQELSALGFDARQSQEALEAHTWNKNAAANWLLQGGSNLPPLPALRRSTTDRSSANTPTGQPGSGGHSRSQSMQQRTGSGRFGHSHTGSLGSGSDWGSGSYTPRSTGGGELSQPGSARTTGDSIPGTGVQFGTPRSSTRKPVTGNARLALKVHKCRMQYRGTMEQPFFTLSVRGRGGSLLEPNQETSPGIYANGVITADHPLVVTTPIAQIPQGSVLFFELKHWKAKERKFSLRGWSLVAVSSLVDYSGPVPQLQTGTIKISMLQKPVDTALNKKHKRLNPEGFDLEINVALA